MKDRAALKGKMSRRKGVGYEREIARFYRSLGFTARRGRSQWEKEEQDSDIVLLERPKLWIECKRYKRLGLIGGFWERMKIPKNRTPVLHMKADKGPALVVVDLETWARLLNYGGR